MVRAHPRKGPPKLRWHGASPRRRRQESSLGDAGARVEGRKRGGMAGEGGGGEGGMARDACSKRGGWHGEREGWRAKPDPLELHGRGGEGGRDGGCEGGCERGLERETVTYWRDSWRVRPSTSGCSFHLSTENFRSCHPAITLRGLRFHSHVANPPKHNGRRLHCHAFFATPLTLSGGFVFTPTLPPPHKQPASPSRVFRRRLVNWGNGILIISFS